MSQGRQPPRRRHLLGAYTASQGVRRVLGLTSVLAGAAAAVAGYWLLHAVDDSDELRTPWYAALWWVCFAGLACGFLFAIWDLRDVRRHFRKEWDSLIFRTFAADDRDGGDAGSGGA